jgi:drug/metabolite transporter (DMT)-like permease
LTQFTGEIAALGAAACWGIGSNFFVAAGRRMGSRRLNRLRLSAALVLLSVALWFVKGAPWPMWATRRDVMLLGASGLAGFVVGDRFYFRSLVILGAGRATLISSTSAIFAAVLARIFLHETLGLRAVAGIALTLGGLAWVLTERLEKVADHPEGSIYVGAVSGFVGAVCSAVGYLLTRAGLQGGLDPLSGTVVRATVAVVCVWLLVPWEGGIRHSLDALRDRVASRAMLGGALFGPFIGVTLSLVALQHTETGVATALMSAHPLIAMLIAARAHGERLTQRLLLGALVTLAGVALLFLR